MTKQGIATVARQEMTIRLRTGRWRWLLLAWFVVLMLFTLLMRVSIARVADADSPDKGVVVYGSLILLVLGLALLVVPALAAQSVNGDRERGTLATLQVTRLTAGDIAVGKLAAAWGTSLVFLLVSLPLVGYAMFLGGVPLLRVVIVTLVLALLLGTVAALALCLSALVSRTTTSGVLAYLVVFALTVGTLIAFGIGTAVSSEHYTQTTSGICFSQEQPCQSTTTEEGTRTRTDRTWWLLAPNPFVILADAAPQLPPLSKAEQQRRLQLLAQGKGSTDLRDADPLGGIGRGVRDLRLKPGEAFAEDGGFLGPNAPKVVERRPVWPYGLGFDVLLGAGAVWLTARRLRTPSRTLPRGQRVA